MSTDLEYSLGLDLKPLDAARQAVGKWGDDTVKVLNQKFSAADLFKGVLQGIGIASAQQIADRLVAPFKESAESAQRIAEWSEKAADAQERMLRARQNDQQILDSLERQLKRIQDEANQPAKIGWLRGILGGAAASYGLSGLSGKLLGNQEANVEKGQKDAAEATMKSAEIAAQKQKMLDAQYDQQVKNSLARAAYVKANREELELEAKALSGRILPAEKARLDILRLQSKERELEERVGAILEKQPEERTEAEKRTLVQLDRQRKQIEMQIDLKQKVIDSTNTQAAAEAKVGEVVESNTAKWREFVGVINSVGRGDKSLTDAELQKKINNINRDLGQRQAAGQGTFWGPLAMSTNYDVLGEAQKSNLSQALAEQRLRDQVRRNAAAFGTERAFQMFGGSQERFDQILRGYQTQNEKLITSIDKLNNHVDFLGKAVADLPVTS